MVGVVALVVVGPERLPRMARVAGLWLGRGRRALASVKAEIDRELKADELREILRKQAESKPLETILEEPPRTTSRSVGVSTEQSAAAVPPAPAASAAVDAASAGVQDRPASPVPSQTATGPRT